MGVLFRRGSLRELRRQGRPHTETPSPFAPTHNCTGPRQTPHSQRPPPSLVLTHNCHLDSPDGEDTHSPPATASQSHSRTHQLVPSRAYYTTPSHNPRDSPTRGNKTHALPSQNRITITVIKCHVDSHTPSEHRTLHHRHAYHTLHHTWPRTVSHRDRQPQNP